MLREMETGLSEQPELLPAVVEINWLLLAGCTIYGKPGCCHRNSHNSGITWKKK